MRAGRCLVLNADTTFIAVTADWFAGVRMLARGRATPLGTYASEARSERSTFPVPSVVTLKRYVRLGRRRPVFSFPSKRNLLVRDNFACAYCGKPLTLSSITRDHVTPVSRGGKDVLTNVVAACGPCNHRKDARTPSEAGMTLRSRPRDLDDSEKIGVLLKTHKSYEREAWVATLRQHGLSLF